MERRFRKIKILRLLLCGLFLAAFPVIAQAEMVRIAIIDSGAKAYVNEALSFTALSATEDPLSHGTQIAKLIRQGNPEARIFMLQVCEKVNGEYRPSQAAVQKAIDWIVQNDIDIVNMSLVMRFNREIENSITNASTSHGIVFVAAAGNRTLASHFAANPNGYITKSSKTIKPAFPASVPSVIAVGGLDDRGRIASYSDKTCDVYAYGKILGQEGSSFACARVTGKIAKLFPILHSRDKISLLTSIQ